MYEPLKIKKRESLIISSGETGSLLKEIEECKERSQSLMEPLTTLENVPRK